MLEGQNMSIKSSQKIIEILYSIQKKEFEEHVEEMSKPNIVYVTELTACSHKYVLRQKFSELIFSFEPNIILGSLIHRGLEDILEAEGYKREVPVQKEINIDGSKYTIKGRIDALNEEEQIVVEIKSARSSQGTPHPHHILQLQIYLEMLGYKKGILVYITPDRMLEYTIEYTPIDLKNYLIETINDLKHPRWHWECKYCIFNRICPYRVEQTQ